MTDAPELLVLDFVEWVAKQPRPYAGDARCVAHLMPAAHGVGGRDRPRPRVRTPVAGQGTMVVVTKRARFLARA